MKELKRCKCGSARLMQIQAHCSDCFDARYNNQKIDYSGYVPSGLNIGSSDDVEITYCLDCGKIQGEFPISEDKVLQAFDLEDEEEG